jgi:hypothetical protein
MPKPCLDDLLELRRARALLVHMPRAARSKGGYAATNAEDATDATDAEVRHAYFRISSTRWYSMLELRRARTLHIHMPRA